MRPNFTEEVMLSSTNGHSNRTNSLSADFYSLDLSIYGKKSHQQIAYASFRYLQSSNLGPHTSQPHQKS